MFSQPIGAAKIQRGFSLLELVACILIITILAVAAFARFQENSAQASVAKLKTVAAAITTGSYVNRMSAAAKSPNASSMRAANVCQASQVERVMGGALPADITISQSLPQNPSCASANDANPFGLCLLYLPEHEDDPGALMLIRVFCTNS